MLMMHLTNRAERSCPQWSQHSPNHPSARFLLSDLNNLKHYKRLTRLTSSSFWCVLAALVDLSGIHCLFPIIQHPLLSKCLSASFLFCVSSAGGNCPIVPCFSFNLNAISRQHVSPDIFEWQVVCSMSYVLFINKCAERDKVQKCEKACWTLVRQRVSCIYIPVHI